MKFKVPYQVYVFLLEFGIFALVMGASTSIMDKLVTEHKTMKRIISLILAAIVVFIAHSYKIADLLI